MARRDSIPPYEIMRGGSAPVASDNPDNPTPEPGAAGRGGNAGGGGTSGRGEETSGGGGGSGGRDASPWWVGSTAPIVLRIPRGLAVVLALALVGLLVLSYWVGHSRGSSDLDARLKEALESKEGELYRALRSAPGRVPGQGDDTENTTDLPDQPDRPRVNVGQNRPPSRSVQGADPRRPGLNYMILATRNPIDGQRLARFMESQGVETFLDPINNSRSVHVVAVGRGFSRAELGSPEQQQYVQKLHAAGRAWKQHNGGRGDDLNSMYLDKYQAPGAN